MIAPVDGLQHLTGFQLELLHVRLYLADVDQLFVFLRRVMLQIFNGGRFLEILLDHCLALDTGVFRMVLGDFWLLSRNHVRDVLFDLFLLLLSAVDHRFQAWTAVWI